MLPTIIVVKKLLFKIYNSKLCSGQHYESYITTHNQEIQSSREKWKWTLQENFIFMVAQRNIFNSIGEYYLFKYVWRKS